MVILYLTKDDMFLQALQSGGVPIKFSSWHQFTFSSASSQNVSLQIQERSRSVKALFGVQRRAQPTFEVDNGACFFDTGINGTSTLQSYQYRIGSRYFPASPVQTSTTVGSSISNGGAEAYIELQKALNIIGDYRLSTPVNTSRWAMQNHVNDQFEFDFIDNLGEVNSVGVITMANFTTTGNSFAGNMGSSCFAMAISLETSSGLEISGLNAEEQSDISLNATWASPQNMGGNAASLLEVYTFYDSMIVLRENNVLELIQ